MLATIDLSRQVVTFEDSHRMHDSAGDISIVAHARDTAGWTFRILTVNLDYDAAVELREKLKELTGAS